MPDIWIPALLRSLTDGRDRVRARGATLAEVIADLEGRHPGLRDRLCAGPQLRPGLAAVVDGNVARSGLDEHVDGAKEIHFVQAIGGGSQPSPPQARNGDGDKAQLFRCCRLARD
jgi:molybdopterin synthase sulfur carrier subunit